MSRPNILFFFSDQQRWDTCGCYGQRLPVTPRLDQMAREGVRFENAFTCQPVCGPARAALQTGKWPTQIGCHVNGIALPDVPTIASAFSQDGYQTAYCGKWHLASTSGHEDYQTIAVPPEKRGGYSDYWVASDVLEFTSHGYGGYMHHGDGTKYEFDDYRVDAVTRTALDFLDKERNPDRPFLLFLSHIEPHHQNDHGCYEGPDGSKQRWSDFDVPGDLIGTGGNWRENYPDYLGCCNSLDENLGKLLDKLTDLGIRDNTIVVYTSDHGSHFCTRNLEYKRSCHDGCTHIPMVISGPGFSGGRVEQNMVSLLDLPRTLLYAAGIMPLEGMVGRPLQETGAIDWPDEIFMQISESHVGRAIRTKKWKYAVGAPDGDGWRDTASDVYVECFLYDLENDPHERNNLVEEPTLKSVRESLKNRLIRCMEAAGERLPAIYPMKPKDRDFLKKISCSPTI